MKKIHRFITDMREEGGVVTVETGSVVRQIRDVLKLVTGEVVALLDGHGRVVEIELTRVGDMVEGRALRTWQNEGEASNKVTMYVAILKRNLFELVVEKMTELGVTHIVPIITDRTVKLGLKHDRLLAIAKEATELSGRSVVPTIHEPMSFDEALSGADMNAEHCFFDRVGKAMGSAHVGGAKAGWIGPEGGWSERECEKAKAAGFTAVSLGTTTLRGETAAIVASYVCVKA